nr:alpha/beta hydrolase [Pseudonocardia acaciae]
MAGRGPVCLVHPGGPGVRPDYLRMPGLEEHLTLIYLDPVGSGDSDLLPGGDYSMSRYVQFANGVLDDFGASTAYFLGHSHGGFVALQYGLDSPQRLDGLILYDTAPMWNDELNEAATKEMAVFVRRWPRRPEAVLAARTWDAAAAGTDNESYCRFLAAILPAYFYDYRATTRRLGREIRLGVRHDPNRLPVEWDVRDRLGEIDVPTLVIGGSYDFRCPIDFAYQLSARMPNARLVELGDSGHFGHIEQPADFTEAIVAFVISRGR